MQDILEQPNRTERGKKDKAKGKRGTDIDKTDKVRRRIPYKTCFMVHCVV